MIHRQHTYSVHNHTIIFETSKIVFPNTYLGFDRCNLKLFASKSRLRIVPSLQNVKNIYFWMIIMSKNVIFEKYRKSCLTYAILCKKNAEINHKIHFCWNLLNLWVVDDVRVLTSESLKSMWNGGFEGLGLCANDFSKRKASDCIYQTRNRYRET